MNRTQNFFNEHSIIVAHVVYAGVMCLMGGKPMAAISLPTTLFLVIHDGVRSSSSSGKKIFIERCAIIVVPTIGSKIFWHLRSPSSPHNISLTKTGMSIAYGATVYGVHSFVTQKRANSLHRDFQDFPVTCLAWDVEEWERKINQDLPYSESALKFLEKNRQELQAKFPMPNSSEEWVKLPKNKALWIRTIHLEEFEKKSNNAEKLQDSLMYHFIQHFRTNGMLEIIWISEICENEAMYKKIKNDPFFEGLVKKIFSHFGEVLLTEERKNLFAWYHDLCKKGEVQLPTWKKSPDKIGVKDFYAFSDMEKVAFLETASKEEKIWSCMGDDLRSAGFNFSLGWGAKSLLKEINDPLKFLQGVGVPHIERLSIQDLEKILEKKEFDVADHLKLLAHANPDSALAQSSAHMQIVDKYTSLKDDQDIKRLYCVKSDENSSAHSTDNEENVETTEDQLSPLNNYDSD